jgi:Rrf2 family protein
MSIIFSRQCEYALQAIMYLALKGEHEKVSIKELTTTLNIPYHFLAKILQDLAHKGILCSQKGLHGGFGLAKSAEEITPLQIIEAIDGDAVLQNCVLGFEQCSETNPCALHDQWKESRDGITRMFMSKNIAEMAKKMKKPQYQS